MTNRSLCCGAGVRIAGTGTTHYFVCNCCLEACDVYDCSTEIGVTISSLLADAAHYESIAEVFATASAIKCAKDQAKLLRATARELGVKK